MISILRNLIYCSHLLVSGCLLGLAFDNLSAQSTPWLRFDLDPSLTAQVGYSRLTKWMIAQADPRNPTQRINPALLEETIARVFASGQALTLLSQDLARGDVDLAHTLGSILASFNFPESEVRRLLLLLGAGKENETLQTTLNEAMHREATLHLMGQYLIEGNEDWANTLTGLSRVLQGEGNLSPTLLEIILEDSGSFEGKNLKLIIGEAQKLNLEAKWDLAEGIHATVQKGGTLYHLLQNVPSPPKTFYQVIWGQLLQEIEQDGLLKTEYRDRLLGAKPLYEEFQALLATSLGGAEDTFIRGYLKASLVEGSRFFWVYAQILKSHPEWSGLDYNYLSNSFELRRQFIEELARRVAQDQDWSDYLLWELTRPAEAATTSLRRALPSALGDDESLCRELWTISDLGLDQSQMVSRYGLFDFYPGGEKEFRRQIENGTAESGALKQFGSHWGELLAYSDTAWSKAISGNSQRENHRLRLFFESAFRRDPSTVIAWIKTIQSNNLSLHNSFKRWLVTDKKLKDDQIFDQWLESIADSIQTQRVIGNPDVANFKEWFLDYLNTEPGIDQVKSQISLESFGIPEPLREGMALTLQRDSTKLWKIYGMLASIDPKDPILSSLIPQLRQFFRQTNLSSYLMAEVAAQNRATNEAMEPAWNEILSPNSRTLRAIIEKIKEGSSLSDLYGLVSLALDQAIEDSNEWPHVAQTLKPLFPQSQDRQQILLDFKTTLFKEGSSAIPIILQLLSDPTIYQEWQKKLLSAVNLLGKGYIIADFILHQNQLFSEWNEGIADALCKNPHSAQTLIESLVGRRLGDETWQTQITQIHYGLARVILENRIVFESLLADKNREFTSSVERFFDSNQLTKSNHVESL